MKKIMQYIFLIIMNLIILTPLFAKEEREESHRHTFSPNLFKASSIEEAYPLFAFGITHPSLPERTSFLIGANHVFPYEKLPPALHNLVKQSSVLAVEHLEVDNLQQFLTDINGWRNLEEPAWFPWVQKHLKSSNNSFVQQFLAQMEIFQELKMEYAYFFTLLAVKEGKAEREEGMDIGFQKMFSEKKMLPLESWQEVFQALNLRPMTIETLKLNIAEEREEEATEPEDKIAEGNLLEDYRTTFSLTRLETQLLQDKKEEDNESIFTSQSVCQRNLLWIERLRQYHFEHEGLLTLIGNEHLLGEEGLLNLLQTREFILRQLWSDGSLRDFTYKVSTGS